jgi:4'-phosphopantetheinyl transferase EntD
VTPAIVERTVARLGVRGALSEAERDVWTGLVVERRRRDWLAGRIAAKRAVRAAFRERRWMVPAYAAITVRNDADGAPSFAVDGRDALSVGLNLSIAHTEGAGLAAVASTRAAGTVGVDVEHPRPLSEALIRYVLSASEVERLAVPPRPAALVLWIIKEAVLKAARASCRSMRDVELSWENTREFSARIAGPSALGGGITLRHGTLRGYAVAVALYDGAA